VSFIGATPVIIPHKARRRQGTWNITLPWYAIAMLGKKPLQIPRRYETTIDPHFFIFPVLLMEDMIKMFGTDVCWYDTYFKIDIV